MEFQWNFFANQRIKAAYQPKNIENRESGHLSVLDAPLANAEPSAENDPGRSVSAAAVACVLRTF
jgi:hypothetical protein